MARRRLVTSSRVGTGKAEARSQKLMGANMRGTFEWVDKSIVRSKFCGAGT